MSSSSSISSTKKQQQSEANANKTTQENQTFHVDKEKKTISLFLSNFREPDAIYYYELGIFFDTHENSPKPHLYSAISHLIKEAVKDLYKTLPYFKLLCDRLKRTPLAETSPKVSKELWKEMKQLLFICTVSGA